MKTIKVQITGTTPLMLSNPQTVNPFNEFTRALKELTSKRTKTDEDQEQIYRLKFLSSPYLNNKMQYIMPAQSIHKSLVSAAKENKLGKKFERSLFIYADAIIEFEHKNYLPAELYENYKQYVDIRPAGLQGSKIPACRMRIDEWSFVTEIVFDETQINDSEVWNALNIAGLRYGIGTYRLQYGRFKAEEIKDEEPKDKKKKK